MRGPRHSRAGESGARTGYSRPRPPRNATTGRHSPPVRRLLRKLAASAGIAGAAAGLMVFATVGSFDGTDPFPHSVQPPAVVLR